MHITWREELTGSSGSVSQRVEEYGRLYRTRWKHICGWYRLFAEHGGDAAVSLLCETKHQINDEQKRDIENMARLRYAEFFEEDKCG